MDFEKVNEFNFLNENIEEFPSRWSQKLVNARNPSYRNQFLRGINRLYIQFFIQEW